MGLGLSRSLTVCILRKAFVIPSILDTRAESVSTARVSISADGGGGAAAALATASVARVDDAGDSQSRIGLDASAKSRSAR